MPHALGTWHDLSVFVVIYQNFHMLPFVFRTAIPTHEHLFGETHRHDWMYTVYGNPKEDLPHNAPQPKGKPVRLTNYVDANLMHDRFTGQSCSGILHFVNQTPIDHFCKR